MRRTDEPDRGDLARAYLANARKCADLVNTVEMPRIGENTDPARVRDIAIMNALLAIAVMQVPDEPGTRLA
ncbi:MAG: hypothetical protein ACRDQ0_23220 [Pseudonocardia sp.]